MFLDVFGKYTLTKSSLWCCVLSCKNIIQDILDGKISSYEELFHPLEKAFDPLGRTWGIVSHLNSVMNTDELREVHAGEFEIIDLSNDWNIFTIKHRIRVP